MRLMLIAGSYPPDPCGVGDYTRQLALGLAARPGLVVGVLTSGTSSIAVNDGPVEVWRSLPDWSLGRVFKAAAILRRWRPEVVHLQYPTRGYSDGKLPWIMPWVAKLLGTRVVQTWHEGFAHDLLKFVSLRTAPGEVIVVRRSFAQQFGQAFERLVRGRKLTYIKGAATIAPAVLDGKARTDMRQSLGVGDRQLIVFFGFLHPTKRVEDVFAIADPARDFVVVIGGAPDADAYADRIAAIAQSPPWLNNSRVLGFVENDEAARIVSAADALILPLENGGGEWNTAVLAGIQEGTFVLVTSASERGYDADLNVYFTPLGDLDEARAALARHVGKRRSMNDNAAFGWSEVARRHLPLYGTHEFVDGEGT